MCGRGAANGQSIGMFSKRTSRTAMVQHVGGENSRREGGVQMIVVLVRGKLMGRV